MKIYAMYLPQFHIVEENSRWWGKDYTDWDAVRRADPFFEGHNQPRTPLGNNYYDLMNKETMAWQADIMQQYGIDGVCMYHYWFKDGRRILEKPAENLLQWKDITLPFCFYWDNASWARSWSKIEKSNEWNLKFERENSNLVNREVLLAQDYGDEISWRSHFEYLLPFFQDERYIRINNKPVFMIYRMELIECAERMLHKWNIWAKESGLAGVYFIGSNCSKNSHVEIDAEIIHNPAQTFGYLNNRYRQQGELKVYPYDELWKKILEVPVNRKKVYESGFVGYDDTPRRGEKGIVVEGQKPEKFCKYLAELLAKNEVIGNEIVFLNAWNEWGESMYLEPDEECGYSYLQAVKEAKGMYRAYIKEYQERYKQMKDSVKYKKLFNLLGRWVALNERGLSVGKYLKEKDINKVAIYGLGALGEHLLYELQEEDIQIVYGIDKRAEKLKLDIRFENWEDKKSLPDVDLFIVTAVMDYEMIEKEICEIRDYPVISLEEIICKMEADGRS